MGFIRFYALLSYSLSGQIFFCGSPNQMITHQLGSASIGPLRGALVQHKLIKFWSSTRSYLTRGEIVQEIFERFSPSFSSSLRYGNNNFDFRVSLGQVDRPMAMDPPTPQKQKHTIIMTGTQTPSYVVPIAIYSTYLLSDTTASGMYVPPPEIPNSKFYQLPSLSTKRPPAWYQERDNAYGNKNQHEYLRNALEVALSINVDSR